MTDNPPPTKEVEKMTLAKVSKFIVDQQLTVEVQDLNNPTRDFDHNCIQVAVSGVNLDMAYQTTNTFDVGSTSSRLDINSESGAVDSLESAMIDAGFDEDYIEDNLSEVADKIAEKMGVQKLFDEYMIELGEWEPAKNSMDANSETFVKK